MDKDVKAVAGFLVFVFLLSLGAHFLYVKGGASSHSYEAAPTPDHKPDNVH